MAKKTDFSQMNTGRVYDAINQTAAEGRKPRKEYGTGEGGDFLTSRQTKGRKGLKLPRINVAFSPEIYDYIKVSAAMKGITLSDFINDILAENMKGNYKLYQQVKDLQQSFKE